MFMDTKKSFTDQMGSRIEINFPPQRIISLVPSQTELLADLGLDDEIIGITKYCVHPGTWQKTKYIVGGTKNFDLTAIKSLKPDLIIGNKEENFKDGIEQLKLLYPVWMSDISTLDDALGMITSIGKLTSKGDEANALAALIRKSFSGAIKFPRASVLYLIWRKPWMAAGVDTFINAMLDTIGLKNSLSTSRYPQLSVPDIQSLNPDYIFLSTEPYPFKEKHIDELSEICPHAKIMLVDGEMFSWYGSRLIKAPDYFRTLTIS
jgi:ABC-type Fe3+-hydroxamate transport system substrate-binding protein